MFKILVSQKEIGFFVGDLPPGYWSLTTGYCRCRLYYTKPSWNVQ